MFAAGLSLFSVRAFLSAVAQQVRLQEGRFSFLDPTHWTMTTS